MKIGYIVSRLPAETFIYREIGELIRHKHLVALFSYRANKTASLFSPYLWRAHFIFLVFKFKDYLLSLRDCILASNNLKDFFKVLYVFYKSCGIASSGLKQGVEHFHGHFSHLPAVCCYFIFRLTKIPYSVTQHVSHYHLAKRLFQQCYRYAKFIVVISEENRQELKKAFPSIESEKIHLIYNGVNLFYWKYRKSFHSSQDRPLILGIGSLLPYKGFEYLIAACRILKERGLDFECKIIGEGPERPRLEDLIKETGLIQTVKLAGYQTPSKLPEYYKEASIFVSPSVFYPKQKDGLPTTLIESLAIGVPSVGTRITGLPEILLDGKTGLLVPQRDSSELAKAIERLIRNPMLQERLSRNGRILVEERFNIEKNVKRLVCLFETSRRKV